MVRAEEKDEAALSQIFGANPDTDPFWLAILQLIEAAEREGNEAAQENVSDPAECVGYLGVAKGMRDLRTRMINLKSAGRTVESAF